MKLVSAIFALPSFIFAGYLDAFPETGRQLASRIFFVANLFGLLVSYLVISSGASELENKTFHVLDISFTLTSVATGAVSCRVPFGVRNLIHGFRRPGSFAVLKFDVVSVKLEQCVLDVLEAAHRLLFLSASNTPLWLMADKA